MLKKKDRVIVLVEKEKERIVPVSFELLRAGRELTHKSGEVLSACIMGEDLHDSAGELAHYADEVIMMESPLLVNFEANVWASALTSLCKATQPTTMIMAHSYDNMELAPKLAFRTESELVPDCVHLERDGEEEKNLLCTKPIYGGNAVVVVKVETRPQMVTLRAKVWHAIKRDTNKGEILSYDCSSDLLPPLTESVDLVPGESVNLDKADVVVAAGRGVKSAEAVLELEGLLSALRKHFDNVELGASRPVVDAGILPRSRQVGQTGEKIGSQLYFAVAISGAAQHVSGIVACKKVIAINKDPDAAIFDAADYGIVAPYEDVLPGLINKLEEL
ncbi:MAG: Acryloyl-CoA reductase electron transfer subunit beta [Syntrophorhabdus sp. PtaU1.Bin050]|nr:MAG: Acryloyl-CoA reductase electron transfer subunit beta [Syntrophorhabdus sp. PtaU1.Bin050]